MYFDENTILLKNEYLDQMTDAQFFRFCQDHQHLRIERTHNLEIVIMSPVGNESSFIEAEIGRQLANWNHETKTGKTFSSSGGFTLPDKSVRSPDASWVSLAQWNTVPLEERTKFAHICPEFVVEVASPSDSIDQLQAKMHRWILNGVQLGFLLDPDTQTSWIYWADGSVDEVKGFDQKLSGEPVLPGFALDLSLLLD